MMFILECLSRGRNFLSSRPTQKPTRYLFTSLLAIAVAAGSPVVLAGWTDPLNTPAVASDKAHQNLLLDITYAGDRLVAVGAYGHIIYSDNAGQSWQQGKVPVNVTLTSVTFVDEQYGWAVGHDGIILASHDRGMSWIKQFDGFAANQALERAAKKQLQQLELQLQQLEAVAAGDDQRQEDLEYEIEDALMALDDARYDVAQGSTKPFLDVVFLSRHDGFAIGAYGMLFRTRDGGANWQSALAGFPNPDRMHLSQFHVLKSGGWLITGEMGLVAFSADYGQSWQRLELPYDGSLFGAVESGDEWLVFGLRGHVFASSDQGTHWREIQTGSEQSLLAAAGAVSVGSVSAGSENKRDKSAGAHTVALVGNAGTLLTMTRDTPESAPLIQVLTLQGRSGLAAVVPVDQGWLVVGEAGARVVMHSEFKQTAGE